MDTFIDLAIVDYRLMITDYARQTSYSNKVPIATLFRLQVTDCDKQTEVWRLPFIPLLPLLPTVYQLA
jgi:hypothetical protein